MRLDAPPSPSASPSAHSSSPRAYDDTDDAQDHEATRLSPSPSPAARGWLTSVRRPRTSPGPRAFTLKRTLIAHDDDRRDSALTASHGVVVPEPASPTVPSLHRTPSLPAIVVQGTRGASEETAHGDNFAGIDTIIPTGGFDDLTSETQISFSKRGSMLLGGKKANRRSRQIEHGVVGASRPATPPPAQLAVERPTPRKQAPSPANTYLSPRSGMRYSPRSRNASQRVLSADEMLLSRKVRSMYQHGNESGATWDTLNGDTRSASNSVATNDSNSNIHTNRSSINTDGNHEENSSLRGTPIAKEPTEAAGGVEDWANLEGGEVDRYGFIVPKKTSSRDSANDAPEGIDEPRIQRVTTALQLLSEEPRKRRLGRSTSRAPSAHANRATSPHRRLSQKSSRPTRSIFSGRSTSTHASHAPLRHAANRLPHNRERRLLDEASDMLKLPPGLAEVEEQREGGRAALEMKAKEISRDEKWRRMARVVRPTNGKDKGAMLFEFDVNDPKLIARTWKGIPDRWRATAWWSFLAHSAKREAGSPSDEELRECFYELQAESSAEDGQIDVDVPRTINRHIMFRRRYRGGQRLLFRVLHAMSLYLPDTGYVQGMAPLAATLLCYYEEDKAFVMLVRLWMLRGLERLYEAGFAGLMDALEDFETNWLRGNDVAVKLKDLGISSTAYGTRWYLTLFNYSLPFPAQLRVWDVFMLLGDASYSSAHPTAHSLTPATDAATTTTTTDPSDPSNSSRPTFTGDLSILHATSTALIDATRDILLDSDFENAMKVLTSWIPIKDEELLMRVTRAEYRRGKRRGR